MFGKGDIFVESGAAVGLQCAFGGHGSSLWGFETVADMVDGEGHWEALGPVSMMGEIY